MQEWCSQEAFFKEGSREMEISDNILYTYIHIYLNLCISVLSKLNFTVSM